MMQIRPRPTSHISAQAAPDFFLTFSVDTQRTKPVRYCSCGTRLARDQPLSTRLCSPCQAKQPPAPIAELHPHIPTPWERQKSRQQMCPGCGGQMHRKSRLCRSCHRRELRAV